VDGPVEWTTEISLHVQNPPLPQATHTDLSQSFIKHLAPHKLVTDGTYGINATHLAIPTLDIFTDHCYPPNNTKLQTDIALVASANKTYLVGEYD